MNKVKDNLLIFILFYVLVFGFLSWLGQYVAGCVCLAVGFPRSYLTLERVTYGFQSFNFNDFLFDFTFALIPAVILFFLYRVIVNLVIRIKSK